MCFHLDASIQLLHNPSSAGVDWRELDPDPVAYEQSHEIAIDSVRDVRQDVRPGVEAHAIERARQLGLHGAGYRHAGLTLGLSRALRAPSESTAHPL